MTGRRRAALVLIGLYWAPTAPAAAAQVWCAEASPAPMAQRDRGTPANGANGGWVEELELDSIADLPWDAFAAGLALSAGIGAGGGMVYRGLMGPKED